MRSILLFFALAVFFFTGCAASKAPDTTRKATATATAPQRPVARGQIMTVRTTAYTHTEPGGRNNAIGTRLRYGGTTYSAASDWSWMPLGTRFYMPSTGRTYVIEDYGSALVGRKTVDLYMPTRKKMNNWGLRHVQIEILEWGSRTMSLKVLGPRVQRGYWHVRTMVAELRKQSPPPERG